MKVLEYQHYQKHYPERSLTGDAAVGENSNGFTLIELLVVLVIVGIVLAMAVGLWQGLSQQRRANVNLDALAQRLKVVRQQAIIESEVIGLKLTPKGFRLYRLVTHSHSLQHHWAELMPDRLSVADFFPEHMDASLVSIDGREVNNYSAIASPQILFWPDGSVTPFRINLNSHQKALVQLIMHPDGRPQVITVGALQ